MAESGPQDCTKFRSDSLDITTLPKPWLFSKYIGSWLIFGFMVSYPHRQEPSRMID